MRIFFLGILLTLLRRDSEIAIGIRCQNNLHYWYDDPECRGAQETMMEHTCQHCGKTFTI